VGMSTPKRTIKAYNEYAEKWAERMRGHQNAAHDFLEKPAMKKLLPDLAGMDVLCVGCGTGEECMELKAAGASNIVGIDTASKMIEVARKGFPEIEFLTMDMENMDFDPGSFDFVYSSLALHYVKHPGKALESIFEVLRPGGMFLFSTHHPAFQLWRIQEAKSREARRSYFSVYRVDDLWFGDFEVSFYHRPFDSIFNSIIATGFELCEFHEPQPLEAMKTADPKYYGICSVMPPFMIFLLKRPL